MAYDVSGYDIEILHNHYFRHLGEFSPSRIRERLERLDRQIAVAVDADSHEFISLGENCGPAVKIREVIRERALGASFFDNIVIKVDDTAKLIGAKFSGILQLKNLEIGSWDYIQSVYDHSYGIYYHHDFIIRDVPESQKGWNGTDQWLRQIDEQDIPLFYSGVRSKFEFLAEKFLRVATSNVRKTYIVRTVEGKPVTRKQHQNLSDSLQHVGARNFNIVAVFSRDTPEKAVEQLHVQSPEGVGLPRWGVTEDWGPLLSGSFGPRATRTSSLARFLKTMRFR